jgi:hypothetical protein
MRAAASGLVIVLALGAAACGLGGPSASSCPGPRQFYLSKARVQGNQVLSTCAAGFHMASRFEIASLSGVVYDAKRGTSSDDSGSGPPSAAATYSSTGPSGWIRTGGDARYTKSNDPSGAATANCAVWTSNSHDAYGTIAFLKDRFAIDNGAPAFWDGHDERCDVPHSVWCVGDFPATFAAPEEPRERRRRRFGGMEP